MTSKLTVKNIEGLTSGGGNDTVIVRTGSADRVTVTNTAVTMSGNQTVSGTMNVTGESTLTGGAKVNTIKHTGGTTAMTISSGGLVLPKKVAFQVNSTDTDQSYTSADYATITWETTALDTASYWDSTNHRYKPLVAGWYLFGGSVRLNTTSVSTVAFVIAKNGDATDLNRLMGQFQAVSDTFTNGEYPLPTGMMQLNGSTDYVDVKFQSEENCTIHDSTRQSFFWGMLVHPT